MIVSGPNLRKLMHRGAMRNSHAFKAIRVLFAAAIAFGISTQAQARDIYFIGTAVSNLSYEGAGSGRIQPSTGGTGCTYAAGGINVSCALPSVKCRVMVVNPSTSQAVNVSVAMSHSLMLPANSASISALQDPFTTTAGVPLNYSNVGFTSMNGWVGSLTGMGNQTTDGDGNVQLTPGNYYIYEMAISRTYGMRTSGAPNYTVDLTTYSEWPYAKWYGTCAGRISVTDVASSNPGFVTANGSLEYIQSSYQNIDIPTTVSTELDRNAANSVYYLYPSASSAVYSAYFFSLQSSTCTAGPIEYYTGGDAWCEAYGSVRGQCKATLTTTVGTRMFSHCSPINQGSISRMLPLQIGTVPMTINGGMPF